ncbi:disulfide bond formation protein DsbB [Evansella caseinilytica]|uniref:Probable disulfide formation protein n=1 Tax=Evansella caseinilytica TaxID=1503961 RepID=A0A1H3PPI4_9BACI|nr:disulfide oxidoreductase [Evansella caseinilytica]SDZ03104.1 disulfide bond formation protein DsbB [Evansella caseinilytica]
MEETSKQKKIEYAMFAAWGIALIATLGSLYFSEVKLFMPCSLCWVQRIFMYPLAITLAIASVKKDAGQAYYTLPLSLIGLGFSSYHYMLEKIPALSTQAEACGIIPCNYEYINWFGFITIPFLALVSFFFISLMMVYVIKASKE